MWKRRIVFVLLVCLALGLALSGLFAGKPEPRYQGHSLSEWLQFHCQFFPSGTIPPEAGRAIEAVQAIGTNALPTLCRWIRDEPSPVRTKASAFLLKLTVRLYGSSAADPFYASSPGARSRMTVSAFEILGRQAAPAVPELVRLMNKTNSAWTVGLAIPCLAAIGPDALPPLTTVLANPNFPNRAEVAIHLGFMRYRAGTNMASAVPLLARCATDKDPALAQAALTSLGHLALSPDISLPPILTALQSTNQYTRLAATHAVGWFGEQARSATPALLQACRDPVPWLRSAATNALQKIAPELLTNPPVSMTDAPTPKEARLQHE